MMDGNPDEGLVLQHPVSNGLNHKKQNVKSRNKCPRQINAVYLHSKCINYYFSSYFRLRFRLPQRKLNQKSTARTDNMIIHLHLFVTILQTQSANFACCNNLFIQTCIFAVHFFYFSAICDFEFFSSHFAVNMTIPCLVVMFAYFLCTNEHPFSILPQNHNI